MLIKWLREHHDNINLKKASIKHGLPQIDWNKVPLLIDEYLSERQRHTQSVRDSFEGTIPLDDSSFTKTLKESAVLQERSSHANSPIDENLKFHKELDLMLDRAISEIVHTDKMLLYAVYREMAEDDGLGCFLSPYVNLTLKHIFKKDPEYIVERFILNEMNHTLENRADLAYRILQKMLDYRDKEQKG